MKNLETKIKILNENRGNMSLYDYICSQEANDPNFYRWIFDEDFAEDFDNSLSNDQIIEYIKFKEAQKLTYDVVFDDDTNSNQKNMNDELDICHSYIKNYNGTNESYFADYKGGTVSIICNQTGEVVHSELVK